MSVDIESLTRPFEYYFDDYYADSHYFSIKAIERSMPNGLYAVLRADNYPYEIDREMPNNWLDYYTEAITTGLIEKSDIYDSLEDYYANVMPLANYDGFAVSFSVPIGAALPFSYLFAPNKLIAYG
jgi:hypothetical protein